MYIHVTDFMTVIHGLGRRSIHGTFAEGDDHAIVILESRAGRELGALDGPGNGPPTVRLELRRFDLALLGGQLRKCMLQSMPAERRSAWIRALIHRLEGEIVKCDAELENNQTETRGNE